MHKFQPRIHLVIVSDQWNASHGIDLTGMRHKTFIFDLTAFTAVTAYQNQLVRKISSFFGTSIAHFVRLYLIPFKEDIADFLIVWSTPRVQKRKKNKIL